MSHLGGGSKPARFQAGNFRYTSSIDASVTGLYARWMLDTSAWTPRPLVVPLHGWSEAASDIPDGLERSIVEAGGISLVPGMRGRDGALGGRDASLRELHDVYDAVVEALVHLGARCSGLWFPVGFSGGGGNAQGLLGKFTDLQTCAVSHFGPSDYANGTTGWAETNSSFAAEISSSVGGNFATVPNNYRARRAREAIPVNLALASSGTRLYLFGDSADTSVDIQQLDLLWDACVAAGVDARVSRNRSTAASMVRYGHGYGYGGNFVQGVKTAEATWLAPAIATAAWTIPATGTIQVGGYVRSSRFNIWLGETGGTNPKTDSGAGNRSASVVYNATTKTFDVTPQTGDCKVRIEVGALVATGNTSGVTQFVVT